MTDVGVLPAVVVGPAESTFTVTCATTLHDVDARQWDDLVPRDAPHLRYGFLRAVEDSGFGQRPYYLCAWRDGCLAGAAAAYVMPVDLLTLAPPKYTRWINRLRERFAPRLLYLSTLSCGPIITNCNPSIYLAADLTTGERQEVIGELLRGLEAIPAGSLLCGFEFPDEAAAFYGPAMAAQGWIRAPSLPGTRLEIRWRSFDEYVASMRKAFRRAVLKDRRASEAIEFEVVDDFSAIGEEAWRLYANVLEKADHVFEKLTPEFFRELGRFEQSRLLTARERATGRLIGIELLLLGDTMLQDIYTGFDYESNPKQRLYFNLLYPVIEYAIGRRLQTLHLGQTSYKFKARLGVEAYPLWLFVKARNRLLHRVIATFRSLLFPETKTTSYRVFREEEGKVEDRW
jgi:predicted N-acyltransferase